MKCDICLKKSCKERHAGILRWLYYEKGKVYLSVRGERKFGKDYLEKLRNEIHV